MPKVIFWIAMVVWCGSFSLAAQDQGSLSPGAAQSTGGRATDPAADEAFEPLGKDVRNLQQSLQNKGGIEERDHEVIRKLRDRAAEFSRRFPNDLRGPALELLLSKWLKDDDLVEQLYWRIIEMDAGSWKPRFSLASMLKQQNRYDEALQVLQGHLPQASGNDDQSIDAHVLYASCLFAEHRFDEVVQVLQALPAEALGEANAPAGAQPNEARTLLDSAQQYQALWDQEQTIRAAEEAADDLPRVMLVTSRGPIMLELFENEAPNTVANFISLAEQNFYNTTRFHRVIPNFMAQGGDPNSKPDASAGQIPGMGNPGYYIPDEHTRDDHRKHFTGSLAMAKTDAPNSAGCQFYITVQPTPHLNGKHTVFGRVLQGLDIARSLKQDDVIELVTVLRKRDHEYTPQTLPLTGTPAQPPPVSPIDAISPPAADVNIPLDSAPATGDDPAPAPGQPDATPGAGDPEPAPQPEPAPAPGTANLHLNLN